MVFDAHHQPSRDLFYVHHSGILIRNFKQEKAISSDVEVENSKVFILYLLFLERDNP
jgi:hypothetical protein